MAELDFIHSDQPQVHTKRRKEILDAHPDVRKLSGPYRPTAFIILAVVAVQFTLAWVFTTFLPWWAVIPLAWLVGAMFSHALYVLIHECTHNSVFKKTTSNKLMAMVCDLPIGFPGALAFRKYHLLHHRHMGEVDLDADMASAAEARVIGNSWWRKTLWMLFFGVSQGLRPLKTDAKLVDRWTLANTVVVVAANVAVVVFLGWPALLYFVLSTLFGLGLHPLGGRWIQEHYVTTAEQETYSYYGPANLIAFNVGYHNEHHDFMTVAWPNLPKLRKLVPEVYDELASYRSWTGLLLYFLFSPKMSPFSRITHPSTVRARA